MAVGRRAAVLGLVKRHRSGVVEDVEVALRLRKPLDLLELHDWLEVGFQPLTEAWARIMTVGSQEANEAAERLVMACSEVLSAATQRASAEDRKQALRRRIKGEVWSQEQQDTYQAAVEQLAAERIAFAKLVRAETGNKTVVFALERSKGKVVPRG